MKERESKRQRGRKESRAIRSRAGCARIEEKLEICGLLTGPRGSQEYESRSLRVPDAHQLSFSLPLSW